MIKLPTLPKNRITGNRIALFGPMCSGKTYQANALIEEFDFTKVAFADRLKELADELFSVKGKDGDARAVLQALGTNLRHIDQDIWVNVMAKRLLHIFEVQGIETRVVVDDVRYPNEYNYLRDAGFLMVQIYTPVLVREQRIRGLYPNTDKSALKHPSEILLDGYKGHITLNSYAGTNIPDLEKLVEWGKW